MAIQYPIDFGRFRAVGEPRQGSFGQTFRVEEIGGPEGAPAYALKWLRPDAPEEGRLRVVNEIWALRQLHHPNIPNFIDEGTKDGRAYFVMTFAKGSSLRQRLSVQQAWMGASGERWVLTVLERVLDAMVHMQSLGIFHRDIKDDNIIADESLENISLVDFGFCKGTGQPVEIESFRNVGAYRYSPPSKLRHPSVVHPTHDVFAVGVTAYVLLTNEYPWSVPGHEDAGHLEARMRAEAPPHVNQLNSLVSPDVAAFIDDLLIINDDHRPNAQSASDRIQHLMQKMREPAGLSRASLRERKLILPRVLRDPIHSDVRLTEFEWGLIKTPEFQRLRYVKQLGLTNLVFPGAEHTRFSHSVGALAVAEKIVRSIEEITGNLIQLEERKAIRAFALVHDITHICFGHTIEDELGFYVRHDENRARYDRLLFDPNSKIGGLLKETSFGRAILETMSSRVADTGGEGIAPSDRAPKTLMEEMIEGPMGADVLDYIDRDAYFCGLDHKVDSAIYRRFSVRSLAQGSSEPRHLVPRVFGTWGLRLDAEFAIESLLLERFALFLKVYSHPAKIAASAMLGKALWIATKGKKKKSLNERTLEQIGDVELLQRLAEFDKGLCSQLGRAIIQRNIFKPIFRSRGVGPPPPDGSIRAVYESQRNKYRTLGLFQPEGREEIEASLGRKSGIEPGKLAIYCSQNAPGIQKVRQYVEFERGRPIAIDEEASPHRRMLLRHIGLWSVYVFVESGVDARARDKLRTEAESYFGLTNELDLDRRQGMLF
jgi:HD superfamily phosphohydrolase